MASKVCPTPNAKEIDIQYLALRVISAFQTFDQKMSGTKITSFLKFADLKIQNKLRLLSIIPGYPDEEAVGNIYFLYTEIKSFLHREPLELQANQPDVNTFFDKLNPNQSQLSRKEKEDIYWKIRLRYASSLVTVALLKLIFKLNAEGYKLTGRIDNQNCEILPEDLSYREMMFMSKINYIFSDSFLGIELESIEETHPTLGMGFHNVITWKDEFLIDPTAMQFGLRGNKKQLVGGLEPIGKYEKRFDSEDRTFLDIDESNWVKEMLSLELHYRQHKFCTKSTINAVFQDVINGRVWCYYCGNLIDQMKKCGGCLIACYCDRSCQVSDWSWHKGLCKNRK